jgi:hypothetical protein
MATITAPTPPASHPEFDVEVSAQSRGYNLAQRVGRAMWLPMFAMAAMAFPAALIVGSIRSAKIHDQSAAPDTLWALAHVTSGLMTVGFAAVFAGVSFAIARILGQFRKGGGDVQEAVGARVKTLRMPWTVKVFLTVMMAATTILVVAAILAFVFAAQVHDTAASLKLAEDRDVILEAIRRIGIALDLFAIVFGLATIITVLRFQAVRIRELARAGHRW